LRRVRCPEGEKLKKNVRTFRTFCLCVMLLLCNVCAAQERCGTEVKLLLSPAEISATVATLKAQKESSSAVYFFDTDRRELLSRGLIVRLRHGSSSDLTVKLRLPQDNKFTDTTGGKEDFKCEVDLAGKEVNTSYSIRNKFSGSQVPETGTDIYRAFSGGQRELLRAAHLAIDWNQVKRVADIKVTDWEIKLESRSRKLALELWEWRGNKILELSSKTGSEEGEAAYEELRQLAIGKGLKLSADQRSKTRMVLESPASTTTH
jgi:hypothetical protein